jgi:hypothetical protein
MAILVKRVSGDYYQEYFFPMPQGWAFLKPLCVGKNMDMDAGMLRMVLGLGTRAVDRTVSDHARIVSLDDPCVCP